MAASVGRIRGLRPVVARRGAILCGSIMCGYAHTSSAMASCGPRLPPMAPPKLDEAQQELEAAGTDPDKLRALAQKMILFAGKRTRGHDDDTDDD